MNAFFEFLSKNDVEFQKEVLIKKYSSVRIGGNATVAVFPDTEKKLILVVDEVKSRGYSYKILGRMSNVLPSDDGFDGVLIYTVKLSGYKLCENGAIVQSGAAISKIIFNLAKRDLGGLEALAGIPGSIGGMIKMNAGAFGKTVSDFLVGACVYFPQKREIAYMENKDFEFGYRKSALLSLDAIVLSVELSFFSKKADEIKAELFSYARIRRETQPAEPSLGSVFKRYCGVSAGKIIDECGLKGRRLGGAMISKKHAGFIVNVGGARAEEYLELMRIAEDTVYEKTGIVLEPEIEILKC